MTPYTAPLLGVASLAIGLLVLGWTRRRSPLSPSFLAVSAAMLVWTLAYVWELEVDTRASMMLATRVQYLAVPVIPVAALQFTLVLSGRAALVTLPRLLLACLIPALTVVLAWTNDAHGLIWSEIAVATGDGWSVLSVGYGPAFWLFLAWSYACLSATLVLAIDMAVRASGVWRWQALAVVVGMTPPLLLNVFRILGAAPYEPLDLTVFGFAFLAIALGAATLNLRMLLIAPVAHDRVFETLGDGLVVVDEAGLLVEANPAAKSILRLDEVPVGAEARPALGPFSPVLDASGDPLATRVEVGSASDHHVYECRAFPVSDQRGRRVATAISMRDITSADRTRRELIETREQLEARVEARTRELMEAHDRLTHEMRKRLELNEQERRLREQLWRTQRMDTVGTLAGGIAHDFNNLLAAVLGFAELAMEDVPEGTEARENVRQISVAANRAKELVEHLLTFSRRRDTELAPFRLCDLVRESVGLLRSAIPTSVAIETLIEPELPEIVGDREQIQQVLLSLCQNGAEAMGQGGTLTIRLERSPVRPRRSQASLLEVTDPDDWLALSVRDTGTGMSEEVQARAFEPFFTTHGRARATGLGLAVVHGIVTSHGGEVEIDTRPGEGTVVWVYLPARN